jgi:hypothetical protein
MYIGRDGGVDMHRATVSGTGQFAPASAQAPGIEPARWDIGTCTNCDRPVPPTPRPQTFCGEECRGIATQVRELRRLRARGSASDATTAARAAAMLPADLRHRVESAVPVRGCDAEDWSTFIRWFQDADQI